jgi:hypothetical protein
MDVTGAIYAYICFFNLIREISKSSLASVEHEEILFTLGYDKHSSSLWTPPEVQPFFPLKWITIGKDLYIDMVREVIGKKKIHQALMEKFGEYRPTPEARLEADITAIVCEKMMGLHVHMGELGSNIALDVEENTKEGDISLTQEEVSVMLDFLLRARSIYSLLRENDEMILRRIGRWSKYLSSHIPRKMLFLNSYMLRMWCLRSLMTTFRSWWRRR